MGDQDDAVVVPLHTLKAALRERRKLADGDDDSVSIFDTQQLAETLSSTMGWLTTRLGAVTPVSLLVGGIGIRNIMLVSVTERTREIGLRLALGGLVGVLIATAANWGLSRAMGVLHAFDPSINLLSLRFSAAIGVLFGYFPARMDPIAALRHEQPPAGLSLVNTTRMSPYLPRLAWRSP